MTPRLLDARGLACPLPVLKARKILLGMMSGEVLRVQSSDPRSDREFALFCQESGYGLTSAVQDDKGDWVITISLP